MYGVLFWGVRAECSGCVFVCVAPVGCVCGHAALPSRPRDLLCHACFTHSHEDCRPVCACVLVRHATRPNCLCAVPSWRPFIRIPHVYLPTTTAHPARTMPLAPPAHPRPSQVSGSEVAQMYLGFPQAAAEPPKLLRGFEKVYDLAPGASASVSFTVAATEVQVR